MDTRKLTILAGALTVLFALALVFSSPANASPPAQATPLPTPTPGADGRIIYIVQDGDSVWVIAAKFNLDLAELYALNNLDPDNPLIVPGQGLLFGLAGPADTNPTPAPALTPTSALPTEAPSPGAGVLCILVYDDINGDAFHQETEPSIGGAAISISARAGIFAETVETEAQVEPVPICLEDLEEGSYAVSVAIPEGYNPTTQLTFDLPLMAGDESNIAFGAQMSSAAVEETPVVEEGGTVPVYGIVGGVLLVVGVGLALFAGRLRRQKIG
ncbi:MAG: LysM peptidoglycan-binding domain-containing protein [Anaerolineales bacterium]|nr:LysM peptidoglycan-binding domain-containing protein [Anaerolineales bacterium]